MNRTRPDDWTMEDSRAASLEQWDVCQTGRRWKICRMDGWPDDAAVDHVRQRAAAGSELHLRALTIHLRELLLQMSPSALAGDDAVPLSTLAGSDADLLLDLLLELMNPRDREQLRAELGGGNPDRLGRSSR